MADYNKVLLMGRLTRDVELKYTPSNMAVANIGLAVNNRYKTKEGEAKEETTFVDCEAWGRTAEVLNQYLAKGRPVFIEGRLKLDQWQDKDGSNRSKMKVVVEGFQFIDSRGGQQSSDEGGGAPVARAPGPRPQTAAAGAAGKPQQAYTGPTHEPLGDDDIPF